MALPVELGNLQLSILGLGVQYPPYSLSTGELEKLAKTFYPDSPAYVALPRIPLKVSSVWQSD